MGTDFIRPRFIQNENIMPYHQAKSNCDKNWDPESSYTEVPYFFLDFQMFHIGGVSPLCVPRAASVSAGLNSSAPQPEQAPEAAQVP